MNYLSISGGSTKAIQLAIATQKLYETGYRPDVIACTSAGSFIAIAAELGLWEQLREKASTLDLPDMFKVAPINEKGVFTFKALWRAFLGLIGFKNKYSFGIQNTRRLLTDVVTEEMFLDYLNDEHKADILLYTVNPKTREYRVSNAKDLTYSEFIEAVEYSAHIPVMTEAGTVRVMKHIGGHYDEEEVVDGGNIAHNPEVLLAREGVLKKGDSLVSIYARDIDFKLSENDKYNKNVFTNIDNTLQIFNRSTSLWGEFATEQYCINHEIERFVLYCPQVLDFNNRYSEDDTLLEKALKETEDYINAQLMFYKK